MFFLKKRKKGNDKGFVVIFFFSLWCSRFEGEGREKGFGERNRVRRRIGKIIFFEDEKRGVVPSGSWIFSATMIQRRAAIIWRVFTTRNDRDSTARD